MYNVLNCFYLMENEHDIDYETYHLSAVLGVRGKKKCLGLFVLQLVCIYMRMVQA